MERGDKAPEYSLLQEQAENIVTVAPSTHVYAMTTAQFGPHSTSTTCPSCHATVSTRVERNATSKTHLIALLLCIFCSCCCCSCLPYCMNSCQAATHYCPNCKAYLGSYDK